ncbi:hypothetical protein D3C73_922610 [compost metagenome]
MQIQQVDIIGVQASQAFFHRTHHAFTVVAARVWIIGLHGERVFGGDHQTVAASGGEFSNKSFGTAFGIAVGGINKIAATFYINVKQPTSFRLFCAPAPIGAKGHGAERQRRNAQARAAKQAVMVQGQ